MFTVQDDYSLVAWTIVVCFLASATAIGVLRLARMTTGHNRAAWIATTAAAIAVDVWATHLIAVMTYDLELPIAYHAELVALAFLVPIGVMTAALRVAVNGPGLWQAAAGGALLGAGMASMHYLGIWSIALVGPVAWSFGPLALSFAIALLTGIAVAVIVARRDDAGGMLAAAIVLALGIVAHQFAAIAAIHIVPDPIGVTGPHAVSHASLAFATAGAAGALILMCGVGAYADVSSQNRLREKNLLLDAALSNMTQGLCMFDGDGRLVLWNERFAQMYAIQGRLQTGFTLHDILRHRLEVGTLNEDAEEYAREVHAAAESGRTFKHVFKLADGREIAVVNEARPGGGWVSTHEDMTELRQREASFRLLFENNPVPMWVYDQQTMRFLAVNNAAIEHYGYTREQFTAMTILDIRPAEDREKLRGVARMPNYRSDDTWRHVKADGSLIEVAVFARALPYDGRAAGICAILDLTDRKRAEAEVLRTRAFLDAVVENIPVTVLVKEARDLTYVLVNRAAEELLGVPRAEILGKKTSDLFPSEKADVYTVEDRHSIATRERLSVEPHTLVTPRNGTRVVTTRKLAIAAREGEPEYLMVVVEDVTERRRAEARIAHMARHDPLTNLPNRAAFHERLEASLVGAAAAHESFALLCLDLDRFKEVNDVFGHSTGDALLCGVSQRLERACEGALLARLGGDEFTVISPAGPQPATAEALAGRLLQAIDGDIEVAGQTLRVSLTIGIAVFPSDGADASTLLANGDAALYRAKAEARGSIRFFEPEMDERLRTRRALQHELRSAVARNELELYYQPQALITGEFVGFEALLRWRQPGGQQIPPSTFIPLAEESGLIITLGEWVLREACREAASWPKPLQIAINLSPVQFQHGDLAALVHTVLLETGLKPSRLELEITEGVLISDFSRTVSTLRRLKSLGVRIAMDDFGTGYSSLSYLQAFPFDKIKIDRAFISNMENNAQSAAIIRAVIGLGRGLDLPITAEGVETEAQREFLTHEACQEIQGYLIGRPQPIREYAGIVGRPPSRQTALAS